MQKKKLTVAEQIEHMKEQGILFNIENEENAREYLTNNTYYFKLKAYAKNYQKDSKGKYINLEYAYLKEISIIDMHFRKLILSLCLQIEHFMKVDLNRHFCNNKQEDGYKIVNSFQNSSKNSIGLSINKNKTSHYNEDLIKKYRNQFAFWNLIEVISFGELISFYQIYFSTYAIGDKKRTDINQLLFFTKQLRNACAHNNCILNNIPKKVNNINLRLNTLLINAKTISKNQRKEKLKMLVVNDFLSALYCFEFFVNSKDVKKHIHKEIELFIGRTKRNIHYFNNNDGIRSLFEFFEKTVDIFKNFAYTI